MLTSRPKESHDLPSLPEIPSGLQEAREALIHSEKLASLGRMAASIAHEINNPLAAVMNLLFLAQNHPNCPPSIRQDLCKAESELQRVTHITRQVLGSYRNCSSPGPVSVSAVVEEALCLFETRIMAKGVKVEKQYCEKDHIISVAGDLRQVFSNLICNSLDAVADGGTIKLRVATYATNHRRIARITIADNGAGIGPAELPRIFEPLFTTKESVGTGLGLWACKQLVGKHHGSIRFRSSTGVEHRGTTFVIELPADSVDELS